MIPTVSYIRKKYLLRNLLGLISTYIQEIHLFKAGKTCSNGPQSEHKNCTTSPPGVFPTESAHRQIKPLIHFFFKMSNLEELFHILWDISIFKIQIVYGDDISIASKWFGNQLQFLILLLDFVDQVFFFAFHGS